LPTGRVAALLVMAVAAVSSSAVLVRYAEVPAVSLAFWRTFAGAVVLAGPAAASGARPARHQRLVLGAAGAALGLHFATWLASLELTSVAASVTLVTTAPLFLVAASVVAGARPPGRTWIAIALAMVGTATIAGGDALVGGEALAGDALALVGAAAMAGYLAAGSRLRAALPTVACAAWTYAGAAAVLLVTAVATGTPLWGYDPGSWLAIAAMVAGPQLAGHTVLNRLLPELGAVTVSMSLLTEPVLAGLWVWLLLGEVPPVAAVLGGPLVVAGLALQFRSAALPP
jgi:drug/metabolite transporter (DMT)-like permease